MGLWEGENSTVHTQTQSVGQSSCPVFGALTARNMPQINGQIAGIKHEITADKPYKIQKWRLFWSLMHEAAQTQQGDARQGAEQKVLDPVLVLFALQRVRDGDKRHGHIERVQNQKQNIPIQHLVLLLQITLNIISPFLFVQKWQVHQSKLLQFPHHQRQHAPNPIQHRADQ